MKKQQIYILIALAVLGSILLGYFFMNSVVDGKHNWSESYKRDSKEPYNNFIIAELLQGFGKGFQEITNNTLVEKLDVNAENASYVFIGSTLYLDQENTDQLTKFVANGNHAFISTTRFPNSLYDEIGLTDCLSTDKSGSYDFQRNTSVVMNFYHPSLKTKKGSNFDFYYKNELDNYRWNFFQNIEHCKTSESYDLLGYFGTKSVNFIRVAYGGGYFYFHSTPIAFTNFQLKEKESFEYASKVFSHLPEGKIYWDEYNKDYHSTQGNRDRKFSDTPLQYILSQPALRWWWYTMLAGLLLYVLFRARRKQRVIPVYEGNTNTSLEFIQTIGRLYFQQNDHKKLAVQEMKLFLWHIRDRYSLPTQTINEDLIKRLALKSEVDKEEIEKIFNEYNHIKKARAIQADRLVKFHALLEKFYIKSK